MAIHLNSSQLVDRARRFKNDLVFQYQSVRIHSEPDPYRFLGRRTPYKILFVLSHMRSGSSLLTHILSSHPEIVGYGETHLTYASTADFKRLAVKVYAQQLSVAMDHPYILDKLLHNNKLLDTELLNSEPLRIIFLLREPQGTLPSLLKLKPHWSEQDAVTYYTERLAKLEEYAHQVKDRAASAFITYDQIVNQTPAVFQLLQPFLGLTTPLSEEYTVRRTTGMKGVGDSSSNIKAGRILRRSPSASDTPLQPQSLSVTEASFEQCREVLQQCCQSIAVSEPCINT